MKIKPQLNTWLDPSKFYKLIILIILIILPF